MYQTKKTYVKPGMKISELIFENPSVLMLLEHFGFDLVVRDNTVEQLSKQYNVNPELFVSFCNLFNGFAPSGIDTFTTNDVSTIISFLRNTHSYYKTDKYPEIKAHIQQLFLKNNSPEIKLVEKFFNEYFDEVTEHLDYEEQVAFPLVCAKLGIENIAPQSSDQGYSISDYRTHHTDIEFKLSELKSLLLKHIPTKGDSIERRRLLTSLFELEFDLSIHSLIEESILIPLVKKLETNIFPERHNRRSSES